MCLNVDQRIAFDTLCQAVTSQEGGKVFLEGFGGTGKTFLINLILAKIRSDGGIALATAPSGVAATRWMEGRRLTFDSKYQSTYNRTLHAIFLLKAISLI